MLHSWNYRDRFARARLKGTYWSVMCYNMIQHITYQSKNEGTDHYRKEYILSVYRGYTTCIMNRGSIC